MTTDKPMSAEEAQLRDAISHIVGSLSPKKLVVAGPGTGKTSLFKSMLHAAKGEPSRHLVLTFINALKDILERDLSELAKVQTLHSYCLGLLKGNPALRTPLSADFECLPGLATLIKEDWEYIHGSGAPHFVSEMRNLDDPNHTAFYLDRGEYYDAVDFDDSVYRAYDGLKNGHVELSRYDLVLVDEYQDFNRLEAGIIEFLSKTSHILIAGDDDQALYSQLRDSTSELIRSLHDAGEYEVHELPFCLRCPEVVVEAVNDIITRARQMQRLEGRIAKSFKHYPPAKGVDSAKYLKIRLVETSVQRKNANYMGKYIEQEIRKISREDIEEAAKGGYPPALVIVAKPYREQIVNYIQGAGYTVGTRRDVSERLNLETGLSILKADQASNLGWRIALRSEHPSLLPELIRQSGDNIRRLGEIIPDAVRQEVLDEADGYEVPEEQSSDAHEGADSAAPTLVRVTSFEGAKGLSAQHVYIAGLHDRELPHDPGAIEDLEICKFIVGLTRTRKSCTLIYTDKFANIPKSPSCLISWIQTMRLERIKVDAAYFRR